jgi:hypothetical protein
LAYTPTKDLSGSIFSHKTRTPSPTPIAEKIFSETPKAPRRQYHSLFQTLETSTPPTLRPAEFTIADMSSVQLEPVTEQVTTTQPQPGSSHHFTESELEQIRQARKAFHEHALQKGTPQTISEENNPPTTPPRRSSPSPAPWDDALRAERREGKKKARNFAFETFDPEFATPQQLVDRIKLLQDIIDDQDETQKLEEQRYRDNQAFSERELTRLENELRTERQERWNFEQ